MGIWNQLVCCLLGTSGHCPSKYAPRIGYSTDGEFITKVNGFLSLSQSKRVPLSATVSILPDSIQNPLAHSVCPERTYNESSNAGNWCHLCLPAGQLSSNHLEKNERGFITWIPLALIETTKLGKQLCGDHFELSTPRIVCRQAYPSNHATSSPEKHYQINLYNEFFLMPFLSFRIGLLTIQLTPVLLAFYVFSQLSVLILRVVAPFQLSLLM